MKKKSAIIVAIILMSIGFAAISTTLIINGNAKVSENNEDFSVIFTAASLDGNDVYKNVISEDKKTITFETNDLKALNQTSVLNYEVTNNSSNYDAEVQVNCKAKENTTARYTSIKNELENKATKILAKETLNGTLTISLNKTSTEEVREEYVCELEFNAVERDSLGEKYSDPTEWTFDYTRGEQTFAAPTSGTYKIETWGAQGGSYNETYYGGYGAYSTGKIQLNESQKIFINVGGKGLISSIDDGIVLGGYNGGGDAYVISSSCNNVGGSGGGATHIALISGVLSSLENQKGNILIVSGGGGGAEKRYCGSNDNHYIIGGSGGGFQGTSSIVTKTPWKYTISTGGTQNTGGINGTHNGAYGATNGSFGKGGVGKKGTVSEHINSPGGGSGFYGGGAGMFMSGGGGSGYIGNSLLTEKSMYCYNCTESSEESTKTISTTCVSELPTENCSKKGNGYVRITLIK